MDKEGDDMEKKTFEISHISLPDNVNALSILLNEKEQVSHIKIGKDQIVFNCLDIEPLMSIIHDVDQNVVIKEIVAGEKREYDFAKRREVKHYFMLRNIINNEDIDAFILRLSHDQRLKDIHYDAQNQLLTLVSSQKETLSLLRKELLKVNPSIEINEHRKPIRSQDVH